VDHTKAAAKPAGSCPVDHTRVATSTAPSSSSSSGGAAAASECPVDPSTRERYLQQQREQLAQQERIAQEAAALDPRNMMPAANQQPAPGQVVPLPTERQRSSIPKAGTEQNWEYPSEQMFYNALVRKGKLGDANENDMRAVVAIHNHTNERAWRELMRWEERHLRFDTLHDLDLSLAHEGDREWELSDISISRSLEYPVATPHVASAPSRSWFDSKASSTSCRLEPSSESLSGTFGSMASSIAGASSDPLLTHLAQWHSSVRSTRLGDRPLWH